VLTIEKTSHIYYAFILSDGRKYFKKNKKMPVYLPVAGILELAAGEPPDKKVIYPEKAKNV